MIGKASLAPDHIPVSKYDLLVVGIPIPLPFTAISGIEEEIENVELPDRTTATGGRSRPVEFTVTLPMHEDAAYLAMEEWYLEGKDRVAPTYKRPATLLVHHLSNPVPRSFLLIGCWCSRRGLPELAADNDGEMATVEYTIRADSISPGT